jgi:hypothetical protein
VSHPYGMNTGRDLPFRALVATGMTSLAGCPVPWPDLAMEHFDGLQVATGLTGPELLERLRDLLQYRNEPGGSPSRFGSHAL